MKHGFFAGVASHRLESDSAAGRHCFGEMLVRVDNGSAEARSGAELQTFDSTLSVEGKPSVLFIDRGVASVSVKISRVTVERGVFNDSRGRDSLERRWRMNIGEFLSYLYNISILSVSHELS